ncbi:MAG: hypothetical protein M1133_16365 [Armatimonadetes bacterium]|nr:hypothetical protein [Armatimonadota bacterium]
MSNRRTFTAVIGGEAYEIPTSMAVLEDAENVSGISVIDAIVEDKPTSILRGILYAGLKRSGIEQIDGEPLTYELIGEVCDFAETAANTVAFMNAVTPVLGGQAKNSPSEGRKRRPHGQKSADAATDSSD